MTVRRTIEKAKRQADVNKYRKYHEEKAQIPMGLPPKEFEERVKALAKKYHI